MPTLSHRFGDTINTASRMTTTSQGTAVCKCLNKIISKRQSAGFYVEKRRTDVVHGENSTTKCAAAL